MWYNILILYIMVINLDIEDHIIDLSEVDEEVDKFMIK